MGLKTTRTGLSPVLLKVSAGYEAAFFCKLHPISCFAAVHTAAAVVGHHTQQPCCVCLCVAVMFSVERCVLTRFITTDETRRALM